MEDLECPLCGHAYDMGAYPDHVSEARHNRFEFECEECGLEFEVEIEYSPNFYPTLDGSRLFRWTDPVL